jgi:hypothetical protein
MRIRRAARQKILTPTSPGGMPLAIGGVAPSDGPPRPINPSKEVVMSENVLIGFGFCVVEVVGIDGF